MVLLPELGGRNCALTDRAQVCARVEVIPAAAVDEPAMANLLELYAHDFSEFYPLEIGPDGRFGYKPLPLYWSEAERYPFLAKVNGRLAGLVLVKRGSELSSNPTVWDMAEFFILRGYRRQGLGTKVAHQIWRRFPGEWEVRTMQSNASAQNFWAHAISCFTGDVAEPVQVEKDGQMWRLYSFVSNSADAVVS